MIAADYIALLLLSTAGDKSREHREIIELNGPGVWLALAELDLVDRKDEQGLWRLTGRGRVLVEHVLELPLPEQVTSWIMPRAQGTRSVVERDPLLPVISSDTLPILQPGDADSDGEPPPKPPKPKPIKGVVPAENSTARHAQARELLDRGFGVNEVAETLELELSVVEGIFFGNG